MYRFNLEALLQYRVFIEKKLQKEFIILKQALFDEKEKLNTYIKEREKNMIEFDQKHQEGISVSTSLLYKNFFYRLEKELEQQKAQVDQVKKQVDEKNSDLIDAIKKRKMLDKLKEKGLQLYMDKLAKKEQKFIDEVAINNYIRNI